EKENDGIFRPKVLAQADIAQARGILGFKCEIRRFGANRNRHIFVVVFWLKSTLGRVYSLRFFVCQTPMGRTGAKIWLALLRKNGAPILIFLENFIAGAAFAINDPRMIIVILGQAVIWDD